MISLRGQLPLRKSSVWGQFRQVEVVPIRYGRQRGRALQYDSSRLRWVWADHPSLIITGVYVDGQQHFGWQWRNFTDSAGQAVTLIEFAQPVALDATVEAIGTGKVSATTGLAITTPGAIIADLAALAGRTVDASWLDYEAVTLGIICAGAVTGETSLQAAIGDICTSVGAVFAPRGKMFARVYPGGVDDTAGGSAEDGWIIPSEQILAAESALDDLVNTVIVNYGHRDGNPSAVIELDCPDAVARYGKREITIEASWIADARVAEALGRRQIREYAEPRFRVTLTGQGDIRPLGTVIPGTGGIVPANQAIVLACNYDPNTDQTSEIIIERTTRTGATIRIVRQSSVIEDAQLTAAGIETFGTERRIKLLDSTGAPLANCQVRLRDITRISDAGGFVTFPVADTPPGSHILTVTKPDGTSLSFTILIT